MRNMSLWLGFTSSVLVAVLGCGEDDGRVEVYPVTGKVLVNGQPAEEASVIFYRQSPAPEDTELPVPAGLTDATGEFQLTSYDTGDGAPAGDYKVAVIWNEPRPADFAGVFEPRDRLGGRYASPDRTDLTATVEEGATELPPFEL